jgi:hypothetical protein
VTRQLDDVSGPNFPAGPGANPLAWPLAADGRWLGDSEGSCARRRDRARGRVRIEGDRAADPRALVLVAGGLVASWLFDLGAYGVALVGEVPRGLPTFQVPRAEVGESCQHRCGRGGGAGPDRVLADGRRCQDVRGQAPVPIDINQESVAQGMANVSAGLFEGMPASTSGAWAPRSSCRYFWMTLSSRGINAGRFGCSASVIFEKPTPRMSANRVEELPQRRSRH